MKIIKFSNFEFNKMKKGGGMPPYIKAENLLGVDSILSDLESINYFSGDESLFFVHKIIDEERTIPAPSNRFINDIKFIFGNNKKLYETTTYDEDEQRLYFIYLVSYIEIKEAIRRLRMFKTLINSYFNAASISEGDFLTGLDSETIKDSFTNFISLFKVENNLNI